jgi:hypothetical protein
MSDAAESAVRTRYKHKMMNTNSPERPVDWSGRQDLNLRPLDPQPTFLWSSALGESSKSEKDALYPILGKALLAGCVRRLVGETGGFDSHPRGSGDLLEHLPPVPPPLEKRP